MRPTLGIPAPTIQRSLRQYTVNGHTFHMVVVEKGSFLMQGDHKITFPHGFELGQYPVTQALWEAVMGDNPADFKGADRPVENVSWNDIREKAGFLHHLNALPKIAALNAKDGYRFSLPTEAQWEYAARGGRYGAAFSYDYTGSNYLPEVGWHKHNSQQETQRVGRKLPNVLGLHDMSGNVLEWCEDVWHNNYKDTPNDGSARTTGNDVGIRVVRGGSWAFSDYFSHVAFRFRTDAFFRDYYWGFRLSRYRTIP